MICIARDATLKYLRKETEEDKKERNTLFKTQGGVFLRNGELQTYPPKAVSLKLN